MNKELLNYPKWTIYFLILVNGIGMMSMDIHLPSLPEIVKDLNTTYFMSQFIIISFYIVGIIARFSLGPLSDSYGRKKILILAFDIQIIGLFLQSFAFDIYTLILGRVIQALASGGLIIILNSIIADLYEGDERSRMFSINEYVQPLSFVLAPVLGAFISSYYGWRGGFVFLLINLIIGRIILSKYMKETNFGKKVEVITFKSTVHGYLKLIKHPTFISYSLIMGFVVSAYMMYAVISSYIYLVHFKLTKSQFAILQTIPLLLQATVGIFCYSSKFKFDIMMGFGIFLVNIFGILSLFVLFKFIPFTPLILLIIVSLICISSACLFPICLKHSLEVFPDQKGLSSSAIVLSRSILIGLFMLITSYFHNQSSVLFALLSILAFSCVFIWCISFSPEKNKLSSC